MITLSFSTIARRWIWAGPVLLMLVAGCSQPKKQATLAAYTDLNPSVTPSFQAITNQAEMLAVRPSSELFTLGPGDRIEIEIIGKPDATTGTFVGPDGKIYFNLLPGLDVWGLTLEQTREILQRELGKYISTPEIAV